MNATEEEITDELSLKVNSEFHRLNKPFVMVKPYEQAFLKGVTSQLEKVENFKVYDDDVWIITYPKSGTRWMQELVWCLRHNLDYEKAQISDLEERVPFFEFYAWMEDGAIDSIGQVEKLSRPRTIKSHFCYEMLPKELQLGKAKIINVIRNPRDVLLSLCNQLQVTENYSGGLELLADAFTKDLCLPYNPYFKQVFSYWNRRQELKNMLVVTYEEMQVDLAGVIRKVAKFLDVSINEEDIPKLCDHLSIDKMRANKMVNFDRTLAVMQKDFKTVDSGTFINKGKTGNWKVKLSAKMVEQFEKWEQKWLEGSDLKFVYEL